MVIPEKRTQARVGEPIAERVLIDEFMQVAHRIFRPRWGAAVYIVSEPNLGLGRPDLLLIVVGRRKLAQFRKRGLRLQSAAAAKALGQPMGELEMGVSSEYLRSLRRRNDASGWTGKEFRLASTIVRDSIAIEAKMSDGRRALQQAVKFAPDVHRAAILMPEKPALKLDPVAIERYGVGVLGWANGGAKWLSRPRRRLLSGSSHAWLAEQLLRAFESDRVQIVSISRKRRTASRSEVTRGL